MYFYFLNNNNLFFPNWQNVRNVLFVYFQNTTFFLHLEKEYLFYFNFVLFCKLQTFSSFKFAKNYNIIGKKIVNKMTH